MKCRCLLHQCMQISVLQCQDEVRGPLAFQMLQLAKLQVEPQLLLVSNRADEDMLMVARAPLDGYETEYGSEYGVGADGYSIGGSWADRRRFDMRMERSMAFAYDKALRRLEQLYVRQTGAAVASVGLATHGSAQTTHGSVGGFDSFGIPSQCPGTTAPAAAPVPQCMLHVAGLMDLGQRHAVGALGALVGYLLRGGCHSV
ncbi:hypothetical protein VOLCADRAFT_96802 [Volvox carteri f. nagariensis]|uniref:Uncharacterized protein n=1 Tax=Volvox carteri f. nagariensis TaxID=3068 RepID=D8UB36_VOLCA|nr:uncharacterized protein VOLCADRAFT_96802 [Volvox carteri f. nagariensis]EFJ43104.1 hypothetical protein VOLCADRAFT_96802 [Volvox carteri f. nagariensis]|eukprot:XP_002955903.1 hypothetical protein VOLCADRAFT_96802 [Volvox carteri f. nagariensis]